MARGGNNRASVLIEAEDRTRQGVDSAKNNLRGLQREVEGIKSTFSSISRITAGAFSFGAIISGVKEIADTQIKLERFQATLRAGVGDSRLSSEIGTVKDLAVGLGLNLGVAAQEYAKFSAATRGTNLEGQQTTEIFSKISRATTALGLSAEDTSGILLALTQSISKGKVQAEELRGQLGERLPGAFAIAARSMGVTTAQLDSMLAQGQVLTQDFLPKFADQLINELGGGFDKASKGMQASVNRMSTAWELLKQTLSDSAFTTVAVHGINFVTEAVNELNVVVENFKRGGNADLFTGKAGLQFGFELQNTPEKLGEARLRRSEGPPKVRSEADSRAQLRDAEATATATATREAFDSYKALEGKFVTAEQKAKLLVSQIRNLGIQAGKSEPEIRALIDAALKQLPQTAFQKIEQRIESLRDQVNKATVGEREATLIDLKRDGATKKQLALADSILKEKEAHKAVEAARRASQEVLDRMVQKAIEASEANERLQDTMLDKFRVSELELEYYDKGEIALAKRIAQLEAERLQLKLTTEELQAYTDQAGKVAGNKRLVDLSKGSTGAKFAKFKEDKRLIDDAFESPGKDQGDLLLYAERILEAKKALEGMNDKLNESKSVTEQLGLTFTSAFEDAIFGTKKVSDALKGLAIDFAKLFVRKQITEKLFEFALGAFSGAGSSTPTPSPKTAALGGPVKAGALHWVGENGPELFVPQNSGTVVPNDKLRASGGTMNFVQNITVGESTSQAMLLAAIEAANKRTKAEIASAYRRGQGAFA